MINVDLTEIHHLAADLRTAETRVVPAVQREVGRAGFRVQGLAQAGAAVDTGTLRSSITTDIGNLSYEVGPEVEYGEYIELGTTGPYVIPGAFGRDGYVVHPGISPQPYLGPAFDRDLPKTERGILKAAADRTLG